MAKHRSQGGSSQNGRSSTVSPARLHQRSGAGNAFGGYTKVNNGDGTFTMKKSGFGK